MTIPNRLLTDPARDRENTIRLPYNFTPRWYQREVLEHVVPAAFANTEVTQAVKRAVLVWHRRAGKDKLSINLLTMLAMQDVGNYLYFSPEISQTRKIIWQGIDKEGFKFIDHIPKQIIARKTEADMLVELVNGSTIQLGGADAYDRNMGTNPRAIVFSEYSLMNPIAWNYYRPILVENNGVAIFIYTPRGHNHGYDMSVIAEKRVKDKDPNWFYSRLSIKDTYTTKGEPIITRADIEQEIEEGMPEEMVNQEFYVSFEAGQVGAYYADQVAKLRNRNRIGDFPWIPTSLVSTAWDLGLNDKTCIWYFQNVQGQCRIIDYDEDTGVPLYDWIKFVRDKPYAYNRHIAPHDLEHREMFTGKSRREQADELGFIFDVQEKLAVQDGINAVRTLLPHCSFNDALCEEGLKALMNYTKVYDEKLQNFRDKPAHDWSSHGADAFRALALGWYDDSDTAMEDYRKPRVLRSMGRDRGYWRKGQSKGVAANRRGWLSRQRKF